MILGQLARNNDEILQAAFQVYGMDKNLHELMDTLTRIAQKHEHRCGVWHWRCVAFGVQERLRVHMCLTPSRLLRPSVP